MRNHEFKMALIDYSLYFIGDMVLFILIGIEPIKAFLYALIMLVVTGLLHRLTTILKQKEHDKVFDNLSDVPPWEKMPEDLLKPESCSWPCSPSDMQDGGCKCNRFAAKITDLLTQINCSIIREKALANFDFGYLLHNGKTKEITNTGDALAISFDWARTPEGYEYWNKIHEAIFRRKVFHHEDFEHLDKSNKA